jgi:two-component system OmpR family response regulator
VRGPLNRILYIEDAPDIQAIAALALEKVGGFSVALCSSGEEALRKAADVAPDLILVDVMMPQMDGPTAVVALRKLPVTAETPVIFVTAKVMPAEVERYRALGALGVIAKPFNPMTLAAQVRALWEGQEETQSGA